MADVLFITGTDTGVGKTLLTALLLTHLRHRGVHALGMKPFCSGGLADVHILRRAQQNELSIREISPFYFRQPLAPLLAARHARRRIPLADVIRRIHALAQQCELLLVEGAGGLMAPLGDRYTAVDVIETLRCPVLLVARNRLGTVNHTLLSLGLLRVRSVHDCTVILMDPENADLSASSNAGLIRAFAPERVLRLPFLGANPAGKSALKENAKKLKKTLAQLSEPDIFTTVRERAGSERGKTGKKILLALQ